MAKIHIIEEKILHRNHTTLTEVTFEMKEGEGKGQPQSKIVFEQGNAVTALLYNKDKGTVILTNQFRLPTYLNGNSKGEMLETCAGIIENGENPAAAMIREIKEETGYTVEEVVPLFEAYSSPGVYKELIHYFLVPVHETQKTQKGGGLAEEGEDLRIWEIPFDNAVQMIQTGNIKDAKTILLLLYVQAHSIL